MSDQDKPQKTKTEKNAIFGILFTFIIFSCFLGLLLSGGIHDSSDSDSDGNFIYRAALFFYERVTSPLSFFVFTIVVFYRFYVVERKIASVELSIASLVEKNKQQ